MIIGTQESARGSRSAVDGELVSTETRPHLAEERGECVGDTPRKSETRVLTILMTDLEGSTRQQDELGNVRAAELVRAHRRVFRNVLATFEGQEVETAGDSFLAVFEAPSEGVSFALQMLAAMRRARRHETQLPAVRVGVNQGEVVVERHSDGSKPLDIYGQQVSSTARLVDLARGGQILCSREVFDNARLILRGRDLKGLGGVSWRAHGPYRFKGVEDPFEVCEVGEDEQAPLEQPAAGDKAWPADHTEEELGWRPASGVTVPGTDWELTRKLGEGEFGEVWLALNGSSAERQVYKFCFRRERVAWLKREARLLSELKRKLPGHPNIVAFGDVMAHRDRPPYYITMEYVEGPSLEEWLTGNPPLRERLDLIAQVADALDAVHSERIYHRDLKPSNILLTRRRDGTLQAKLSDFGLGTADDPEVLKSVYASRVEGVAGAWAYIAPEMQNGGRATPQSELYSLGLTLYQVAVGDTRALLYQGWQRRLPDEILREDIERCTATDPERRWRRASELALALRRHDARLHERLREQQLQEDRERQSHRAKRVFSIGVAVVLAALVVLVSFSGYQWWRAIQAQEETASELYYSNILVTQRHIENDQQDLARKALWKTPEDHRHWEWGYLLNQTHKYSRSLEGHSDWLYSAEFSPDGTRIVSASQDGTARVWDAETGELLRELVGHDKAVTHAHFNWNGSRIVTASHDKTARFWNAQSGEQLQELTGHTGVISDVRFRRDGNQIVTASYDNTARIWEVLDDRDGAGNWVTEQFVLEGHTEKVTAAAYSLDSRFLVTASRDRTARIWDAETGELLHELLGHEDAIEDARFSWNGSQVVTGSHDHTARIWDRATGEELFRLEGHSDTVRGAEFSRDDERVVTASQDGTARIWDAHTGKELRPPLQLEVALHHARFHPHDSARVVVSAREHTARLWEVDTGEISELDGHGGPLFDAVFSDDGEQIITASKDRTAKVWSTPTGQDALLLSGREPWDGDVRFGPQASRFVAVASGATVAHVWDVSTHSSKTQLRGHEEAIEHVAISPDGHRVVTASNSACKLHNIHSGKLLKTMPDVGEDVELVRFSPDGARFVVVSGDSTVTLFDGGTGTSEHTLLTSSETAILHAAFNPDGRLLVTAADDGTTTVWDVETGEPKHSLTPHDRTVHTARFSNDGLLIVTASDDRTATIHRASTGEVMLILSGHEDPVVDARFSPDDQRVITASADHTAQIWNAGTGQRLFVLEGHSNHVLVARYSADGRRILTASHDHTAKVWDGETGRELFTLDGHDQPLRDARFSPDGRRIITLTVDRALIWRAAPWALDDLPGDDALGWEQRFDLWRRN